MAFSGSNLRIARVFRGWSQEELAKRVYAATSTISNVERGREPDRSLRSALALVLGFEAEFFDQPLRTEFTVDDCHFRTKVSTDERARKRVLARGSLFARVVEHLQGVLAFPAYNVPALNVATDDEVEAAAETCRAHWGLGKDLPIEHMGRVLENNGVIITRLTDSLKLDAFSTSPRGNGPGFVVLNDAKGCATRSRMDMAHELGHLVMHRNVSGDLADRERQATRFASAFLLPAEAFRREFWAGGRVDWSLAFRLKARWKVSLQAMLYRASDLGVINAVEFRRAYKMIAARRWLVNEPHEPQMEEPELFAGAMRKLREKRGIEAGDIADAIHWTPKTFEEVTGWKLSAVETRRLSLVKPVAKRMANA